MKFPSFVVVVALSAASLPALGVAAPTALPAAPTRAAPASTAPRTAAGPASSVAPSPAPRAVPSAPAAAASTAPSTAPPAAPAPGSAALPSPHGGTSPHGLLAPQGTTPTMEAILSLRGSPFASEGHRMLAALARRGHATQPQSSVTPTSDVSPGTIAVLVQDGQHRPLGNVQVKLLGVRKSIEEGDKPFSAETMTTPEGMAAFRDQPIDTIYQYEVVVEKAGATYSSGDFVFEHGKGAIVSLFVFEATPDLNQTFIFSRALYAIEPRADVFQIQALYRIQNASIMTWSPVEHPIRLPPGASAFQPPSVPGMQLRQRDETLLLTGTFPPGQKEFSFAFQLPNPREASAHLTLPQPPHLADAKIILESSNSIGLVVPGFNPAQKTLSPDGQAALLADQDFLQPNGHAPGTLALEITGIPAKSRGPVLAAAIALLIIVTGVVQASSRAKRKPLPRSAEDERSARELLLNELVHLERAHRKGVVGPKTYQRTRSLLLDALARLEPNRPESDSKEASAAAPDPAERPEA